MSKMGKKLYNMSESKGMRAAERQKISLCDSDKLSPAVLSQKNAPVLTNQLIFTAEVVVNFPLIFAAMPNCMADGVVCNTHPDTELHNIALSIYSGRWAANK